MFILKKTILFILLITFSLYAQSNYSQAIKEKKIYPMGKKIYKHKCQDIDVGKYKTMQEMQEKIKSKNLCKVVNKRYFEALSLYLWEIKNSNVNEEEKIIVKKDEKCPVCGMFVYKYPRWATQIFYSDKHYSFDGMKDLFKYYFEHNNGIKKILVLDYYSQKAIDARKAFYVIGSDIYGPMGNELIAFKNKSEAKVFYMDHRGTKVLGFDEITEKLVYQLNE